MSNRVICIEPTKHDITRASKYGEIVYIFNRGEQRSSIWSDDFIEAALSKMKDMRFSPDEDIFLAAGPVVPLMKVGCALAARYSKLRVLFYSATDQDYVLQEIRICDR